MRQKHSTPLNTSTVSMIKKTITLAVMTALMLPANAQMDNVVEVETNYRPTVKDADKINVVPKAVESTVRHYNVDYSSKAFTTDQYVFQPMWAQQNQQLLRPEDKYFATFGYGTEGNVYGRFAGEYDINRNNALRLDYSTQGHNTENASQFQHLTGFSQWCSRFYTNRANLSYIHRFGNSAELTVSGGYGSDVFNYQPYYPKAIIPTTTDKQHNTLYNADVSLTPYSFGKFAIGAEASYKYFAQKAGPNEERLVTAELTPEYDLGNGMAIDLELGFDHAHYGMGFAEGYTSYDATPHFRYQTDAIDLSAGVYVNKELEVAPDVEFTYHASPRFDIYLNAQGGETRQNMRTFSSMSPYFRFSELNEIELDNSFDQLQALGGVRWNPLDGLYIDLSAGYDIRENVAEIANPPFDYQFVYNPITFADHKRLHAHADIDWLWRDRIRVNLKNTYNRYDWDDDLTYVWRPVIDANWNISARLIDQLRLGIDFTYQTFDDTDEAGKHYDRPNTIDLGASLTYTFPFHLTLYAKGNNLLGRDYRQYQLYPALDRNFLFGAAITF